MLQTPSHLARACGQSHYKKFWLMQTQTESQDNCSISSPSARSFPVAILKGSDARSDGKISGNPASRSFATEIAPQVRATWPIVGSSDAGFGGMSNAHLSNVSISTCAESLRLQQPDASSSRLSRLPSENCLVVMDVNDNSPNVAEPRRSSSLSAPLCPCVSPSPNLFSIPDQAPNECTSRETGFQEVQNPFVGSASEKDLRAIPSGNIQRKCEVSTASVQDALEADYTCSTGSDSCVRGERFSEASAQENAFKYAIDSPSVSSASKRCVESNNSSAQENPDDVKAQFSLFRNGEIQECCPPAYVEQHEEFMADPPGLCAGRSVLRTCKLCGTTKTPLWRSGPQGPKSLCNACGIRFKKLKRSQAARECEVEVSRPTTPTSTKFSARPLKRKSMGEKEYEAVKGRSHQRFKRSACPTWMVARRNLTPKVEDTESCLTSPGTPSPRKQISNISRASIRRRESAAKLALLENQSRLTSVFAADVKEAAVLLMALSCGLVLV